MIIYGCLAILVSVLFGYIYILGKANGKLQEQLKSQNNAIKEAIDVKKDNAIHSADDIDTVRERLRETATDN